MSDLRAQIEDPKLTPFERIVLLFQILRSPQGCAWDRKQTHTSLLPYLIEEAFEAVEAIEGGNPEDIKEELGDVLTQVIFHAQLAAEKCEFDMNDVIAGVVTKLVNRHPHVFGEKAGGVGFDWKQATEVMAKIDEELAEVKAEFAENNPSKEKLTDEIGDLLFATASLARKLEIEPEVALRGALSKFRERFERLEGRVRQDGRTFDDFSLEELESIWQSIKTH
jgi:tetrapyrrole methylase family protein / MazG family protein